MNIGDVVIPRTHGTIFRSGCSVYSHAICVSVDPLILISEHGDMRWNNMEMSEVKSLCKADDKIIKRCFENSRGLGMEKIFLIYAGTGCTCCNHENHFRGPYKSSEDAERRVAYYKSDDSKYWPLASQYARRGTYSVEEVSVEAISDDRYILGGDAVVNGLEFIEVNEDGTVSDNQDEQYHEYDG